MQNIISKQASKQRPQQHSSGRAQEKGKTG